MSVDFALDNREVACLVFQGVILRNSDVLKELGMSDGARVDIVFDERRAHKRYQDEREDAVGELPQVERDASSKTGLVALDALPVLQRSSYTVVPSLLEMARMSEQELSQVTDFRIENEHGSITFTGNTDLRGLDLDELVEITRGAVTVYPPHVEDRGGKPPVGQGLNKKAIIRLKNCVKPRKDFESYRQRVKNFTETKLNGKLLELNPEAGEWVFMVKNF